MSATPPDQPDGFRAWVRAWFEANAPTKGGPDDFSAAHLVSAPTLDRYHELEQRALTLSTSWQAKLFAAGLAGRSWPRRYGGLDAPAWQDEAVAEEQSRHGVSTKMLAVALEMVPPVLLQHGTEDLREAHLPRILRGDEVWCQLLSEPGAGSDLASLRTLATPVGGGWRITGQKVWTSSAAVSDFALLVARSDRTAQRHAGLSCFVLDMKAPGIELRPLRQMTGAYHFNEVFLEEAFVPERSLVGGLHDGWSVLRTMLTSERAAIGGGTSARSAVQLASLARARGRQGEPVVRQLVAAAHIRERVLDLVQMRLARGDAIPGGGSLTKLLYSEHARISADAATRILGVTATITDDVVAGPWVERLLFAPGLRLGGGTDEIQRNLIAERGLGLPRES